MTNIISTLEKEEFERLGKQYPDFAAGDRVRVNTHVIDGSTRRLQAFEGVVIAKKRSGLNGSFIVRRASSGENIERTFQLCSPLVESIEVLRHGDVRRSKLYYLRQRSGKSARIPEKLGAKRLVKPS
jgi:large subunit ribosomal protein L19